MKFKWHSQYTLIIIILISFVSRLPQLFGENLLLDGDECIVGLMAKHFSEGIGIPYFFYGQSYGFSFFEVGVIRVFYWIFGISDISIKLAMLSLWTMGILFFYKTLKEITSKKNSWIPLLLTLILIFSPAWAIWSMKARGGYLTAFLFSFIIIYLISHKKWKTNLFASFIIGLATTLIYQSQALWLAGLLPILGYHIFQNKKNSISLSVGLLVGISIFYLLKTNLPTYWSPQILSWPDMNLDTLFSIPKRVYQSLTGSYSYGDFKAPIFITKFHSFSMVVLIIASLSAGVICFFKKKKINPLFYVLCCSVVCSIGYLIFINDSSPRYLLPLSGFAFLMFFLLMDNVKNTKVINLSLCLFILIGAYSMYDFKNYRHRSKPALISLIQELESRDIGYVYCENGLLQWNLMFYSNERIKARYKSNVDRYPKYIKQVDQALNEPETKIALVGIYKEELSSENAKFISIKNIYSIYENPKKTLLIEHGFNLDKTK